MPIGSPRCKLSLDSLQNLTRNKLKDRSTKALDADACRSGHKNEHDHTTGDQHRALSQSV